MEEQNRHQTMTDQEQQVMAAATQPNIAPMPSNLAPAAVPKVADEKVQIPGLILAPPSTKSQRRQKRIKSVLIALAGVIALVAVSAFLIYYFVDRDIDGATRVSDDFVAALGEKNADRAYNDSSNVLKESVSRDQLSAAASQLGRYVGDASWQIDKSYVAKTNNGTHAAIVYRTSKDGKQYYLRVMLDKNDQDAWQVRSFLLSQKPLDPVIS